MDFSSRLSIYDFLTMLVTGFFILLLFIQWECIQEYWFIISILSYIIGLIYHRIIEILNHWISNFMKKRKLLFEIKTVFVRNYNDAIMKMRQKVLDENADLSLPNDDNDSFKKTTYYTAYYSIMNELCYNAISVLEIQVAFTRNVSWLIMVFFFRALSNRSWVVFEIFPNNITTSVFCIIVFFASFFVRYYTQMKIYKLVWEGYAYTNKSQEKKNVVNQNIGIAICSQTLK